MTFRLHRLRHLRTFLVGTRRLVYTKVYGMDLHPTVQVSLTAKLDRTHPTGVCVRAHSYLALGSTILTHDRTRGLYVRTVVEENCFIGAKSILLPGVTIGRNSIVGAGAVVTKDVPPYSAVAGNPARVIRSNIDTIEYGRLRNADETTHRLIAQAASRGRA